MPHTVVLPRLDGEGAVEYMLEYSGLPNQCGRCRARDHQVRHCPKKKTKVRRPEQETKQKTQEEPIPDTPQAPPDNPQEAPGLHTTPTGQQRSQEDEPTNVTNEQPLAHSPQPSKSAPDDTPSTLQRDEVNFPHLQSPAVKVPAPTPTNITETTPTPIYVWRSKPQSLDTREGEGEKGKGKEILRKPIPKNIETTPLTKQGYRSGRLAEDFWAAIGMTNIPHSPRKKLRVIPFLMKNPEHEMYMIDDSNQPFSTIVVVQIAEQLAGIPWTTSRARQHIVNEVAQILHKPLIFNSNQTSPFQSWTQGKWFSEWHTTKEGEHICTLYACISVQEQRVKIRKGYNLSWRSVPAKFKEHLAMLQSEDIQPSEESDLQ